MNIGIYTPFSRDGLKRLVFMIVSCRLAVKLAHHRLAERWGKEVMSMMKMKTQLRRIHHGKSINRFHYDFRS